MIKKTSDYLLYFSVLCILGIVIFTFLSVVMRYIFRLPIPGVVEITEPLMVAITFLSAGAAQFYGRHISLDFIIKHVESVARGWIEVLVACIGLGIFIIMVVTTTNLSISATITRETRAGGVVPLALWPFKWSMVLGSFIMVFVLIVQLAGALKKLHLKKKQDVFDSQSVDGLR